LITKVTINLTDSMLIFIHKNVWKNVEEVKNMNY